MVDASVQPQERWIERERAVEREFVIEGEREEERERGRGVGGGVGVRWLPRLDSQVDCI